GDQGAEALATSPALCNLVALRLTGNQIRDAGALALANSPYLRHIRYLSVTGNPIGRAGWDALVARFGGWLRDLIGTYMHELLVLLPRSCEAAAVADFDGRLRSTGGTGLSREDASGWRGGMNHLAVWTNVRGDPGAESEEVHRFHLYTEDPVA